MKDWLLYFFGQGTEIEFSNFTFAHFAPILFAVGIILLTYRFRNALQDGKWDMRIRYFLSALMILSEMAYYWRLVALPELGPNPVDHLPITVCGWAVVLASYMMIGKSQTLFDIAYFWLFSGSIFALITPTVITYTGPTRFRYYQFWLQHTIGYIGVFYMIFVHKMRPNFHSIAKAYVALLVLAVIAFFTNRMIGPGANYLFLAKPEDTPSVLDILPPNFVLRTLVMVAVISALFFVSYLPWFLKDRKAQKVKITV